MVDVKLTVDQCNAIFNTLEDKVCELKHDIENFPEESDDLSEEVRQLEEIQQKVNLDIDWGWKYKENK